jgi:hypothetical protein
MAAGLPVLLAPRSDAASRLACAAVWAAEQQSPASIESPEVSVMKL